MAEPAVISCAVCDGSGLVRHPMPIQDINVARCTRCNGTGRIPLTEHHEEAE